jgi:hypothetical protein
MRIDIHPHTKERMSERGASEIEIRDTVRTGEQFKAKFGRVGFRKNFAFRSTWRGKKRRTKQIEAFGVRSDANITIVTVIVRYF